MSTAAKGTSRFPTGWRLALRVVAVTVIGLVALMFVGAYVDGRRADAWNYQSNMWMALVSAAIGVVGFLWPRVVGWGTLPFAALWLLWAVAYAGVTVVAFVVGGVPLAVSLLLLLSANPRRPKASVEPAPDEGT